METDETPVTYECTRCGTLRPSDRHEQISGATGLLCWGDCYDPSDERKRPIHENQGYDWNPAEVEVECPVCGYETLLFSGFEERQPCPMCPPEGSDGLPSRQITEVSGVDSSKAEVLRDEGIRNASQVSEISQSELAEVDGISDALAARMKADVAGEQNREALNRIVYLRVVNVRMQGEVEH